jgi:hypothetical protein
MDVQLRIEHNFVLYITVNNNTNYVKYTYAICIQYSERLKYG